MQNQGVSDIDVLALSVRDPESKKLINEAITAYRGGALRSAIMSTWISVVYDIFSKSRELSVQGDAAAAAFTSKVDAAIDTQAVAQMQAIERDLLDSACSQLQLLTKHEYDALKRIQYDRNLCAHPAFVTDDDFFQPVPDLVRSHIVHALRLLLIHAPLQGKSALARFRTDILSPSYPRSREGIRVFVVTKYLGRAKDVLVSNLIKVLIKSLFLDDSHEFLSRRRLVAWTLSEVAQAKPAIFEAVARPFVGSFFEGVEDEKLMEVCVLLGAEPRMWDWFSEAVKLRVRRLIEDSSVAQLKNHLCFDAFSVQSVSDALLARFYALENEEQVELITDNPKREFVDQGIRLYSDAPSYRESDRLGQSIVVPLAVQFTTQDVQKLLDAVLGNSQISYASGTADVLLEVFRITQSLLGETKEYWQGFVNKMTEQHGGKEDAHYSYPSIRARLAAV
ncbi:hypothetical protein [Pseudomonas fragi]|uniref:Uncharacterized protein n=1 Tax=Pseudomonas fragi TaxID=296 RepID=A0A9Q5FMZ4_PSEFR|nr:hypothetical protein [Pseudomonas fragi]NNB48786.1 hypothetical protein [Pseudomonas fragi]